MAWKKDANLVVGEKLRVGFGMKSSNSSGKLSSGVVT